MGQHFGPDCPKIGPGPDSFYLRRRVGASAQPPRDHPVRPRGGRPRRLLRTLKRSKWAKKRRIVLGPPEEWDVGAAFGKRRVLNFADPEGVFFQLVQQPASPLAFLHPLGYDSFPSSNGDGPKK